MIISKQNLHPSSNSGESVVATVSFGNRILSLDLELNSYENHFSRIQVNFDSPREMRLLAKSLEDIANKAEEFLKDNL